MQFIINSIVCSVCGDEIQLKVKYVCADSILSGICKCGNEEFTVKPFGFTRPKQISPGFTENNLKWVYLSLIENLGYAGMSRCLSLFGTKVMARGTYTHYCEFLYHEMHKFYDEIMEICYARIGEYYASCDIMPDSDGILNINVSYDGTWMTRGYQSHIGCGFVIETDSGIVVDFEVLCNYCDVCETKKGKLSETDFQEWHENHVSSEKCHKNFEGKSGEMEKEGALRLWQRSRYRGFQYVTFLGDGDSAAYNAICALNDGNGPYENVDVSKEECINHVSKRMGSRLRKLKKDSVAPHVTKAGKTIRRSTLGGSDMLSDPVMKKYQSYFRKAITENLGKSVKDMKKAVLSSYMHAISTRNEPKHNMCPDGVESWCYWNRAKAEGKNPKLIKHKDGDFSKIHADARKEILGIYLDLSQDSLLKRCLRKKIQNINEGLHSKLWKKCSKTKFAGPKRVHFASQITVLEHNVGYEHANLLEAMCFGSSELQKVHRSQEKERLKDTFHQKKNKKRKCSDMSSDYVTGGF